MDRSRPPALTPEESLLDTARFSAAHAGLCLDAPDSLAWLVTGTVLLAQQAAALALKAAGDAIPAQVGAAEILLRAASKDRLTAPYTLPFGSGQRRDFDLLVVARNGFMHPRAGSWHVTSRTLARGLPVATGAVRHLILTQPILPDLISPAAQDGLQDCLEQIEAVAEFFRD